MLAGASPTAGRTAHASVPHVGASHSETYKLTHILKPTHYCTTNQFPLPRHTSVRMAIIFQTSRFQDEKPPQSRARGPPSHQLCRALSGPAPSAGRRPRLRSLIIPETHRRHVLLSLSTHLACVTGYPRPVFDIGIQGPSERQLLPPQPHAHRSG